MGQFETRAALNEATGEFYSQKGELHNDSSGTSVQYGHDGSVATAPASIIAVTAGNYTAPEEQSVDLTTSGATLQV